MKIFETIREALQDKEVKIVLPEGEEPRILQATKRLVNETSITPVLLGNPEKIRIYLEIESVTDGYEVIDPQNCSCLKKWWQLSLNAVKEKSQKTKLGNS